MKLIIILYWGILEISWNWCIFNSSSEDEVKIKPKKKKKSKKSHKEKESKRKVYVKEDDDRDHDRDRDRAGDHAAAKPKSRDDSFFGVTYIPPAGFCEECDVR